MNKLTKLLSVFVIAGAMAGAGAIIGGCTPKHSHFYKYVSDGAAGHHQECVDGDDKKETVDHNYGDDRICDDCEYDKTVHADGVTISGPQIVDNGAEIQLEATVSPETADITDVVWSITAGSEFATIDAATGVLTGTGIGTVTVTATVDGKSATYTVTVEKPANVKEMSTVKDFLAFRRLQTIEAGEYKLMNDIDLEGVTLDPTVVVLGEGVIFNGQGFNIMNATYADAAAKTGIIAASVEGGEVKDVKFLGCAVTTSNESPAIVAGLCEGGKFSKIEFNSCSVINSGNYGGMLFARNTVGGKVIEATEITAKNGCSVSCAEYGGFLMGDMVKDTVAKFNNLDITGEVKKSKGNASFIGGRTREGSNLVVRNAVISAEVENPTQNFLFSNNGKCAELIIENVLVLKSNTAIWNPNKSVPTSKTITNLVTAPGVTLSEATATDGQNTVAYLTDTMGFNFTDVWMAEGTDGYRLKAASTNVKSADAKLEKLKANINNAKIRYKKGEEFTLDGLTVMGVYSDKVQLVLKQDVDFTVDNSAFNKDAKGEYTIVIKSVEDATKTVSFKVNVVEEVGFKVYDEFMSHTYMLNSKLDSGNLVVKSVWSDGVEEKLAAEAFSVNAASYDMTKVGGYDVWVEYGSYEKLTFKISVVNTKPVPVDGKVYVNVAADFAQPDGTRVKGVETFKSVAEAIKYLEACKLDASVQKIVNVGAGTYKAKITTSLSNLVLIGEGTDKSVLTYSAVESTVNMVDGTAYGLKCATLHVSGSGFKAYNMSIRNDFDYINDSSKESSPQGLALTIEGDGAVLSNCYLYGNQDTLYLKKGRAYFYKTRIDGNIDFIFGEQTGLAFFEECTITAITKAEKPVDNNGYVTAMKASATDKPDYGYIFYKSTFTDDGKIKKGSMSLGRPWGAKATVAYIECSFTEAYSTLAYDGKAKSRWYEMSGNSPAGADFCEYKSTGAGAISQEVAGGKILTDEQAANYTKANIFAKQNGLCKWDADWNCDAALQELTAYAASKVAPTGIAVTQTSVEVEVSKTALLLASVAPWNANDKTKAITAVVADSTKATYDPATGIVTGVAEGTTKITFSADGFTSVDVDVTVKPKSSDVYTYTYGGTNDAAVWVEDTTQGTITSNGATAIKLIPGTYLTVKASGSKAVLSMSGFTTGSSKASKYVSVEFLDATGNVVKTVTGTTVTDKKNGAITFDSDTVEVSFASIRITSNTAGKSVGITSATITVS